MWKSKGSTEVQMEKLKRSKFFGDADVEGKVIFKCFVNTKRAKHEAGPASKRISDI